MKPKRNIWTRFLGLMLTSLMVFGMITVLGSVSADGEEDIIEPDFAEIKLTEQDIEDTLGGGEFIGISNDDKDAMIGVLYGTEENPNNVYLVSIYTRYIGAADVYENGELKQKNHPIPVRTLFAQRFGAIYEFNDVNDDGLFDSSVEYDNGTQTLTREAMYKRVNTYTAWERSEVQEIETDNDTKEWTFSLTAKDLRYKRPYFVGNQWKTWNQRLEELTLTFHLYVTQEEKTKENVPVWKVDVSSKGGGNYEIDDTEFEETRAYKGMAVDASFKYDSAINGWDFDSKNTNPSLLWVTQVMFANAMSDEVAGWAKNQLEQQHQNEVNNAGDPIENKETFNAAANFQYETPEGEQILGEDDASGEMKSYGEETDEDIFTGEKPKLIKKNKLSLADEWENVGQLTWVSDVDVDGEEDEMFFQIYGGRSFAKVNWDKGAVGGVVAMAGFSYPGGDKIFHDPTYSSNIFQITEGGEMVGPGPRGVILAIAGFLLIVMIIAIVMVVLLVKFNGSRSKPQGRMDNGKKEENEEDYYDSYYMDRKR